MFTVAHGSLTEDAEFGTCSILKLSVPSELINFVFNLSYVIEDIQVNAVIV